MSPHRKADSEESMQPGSVYPPIPPPPPRFFFHPSAVEASAVEPSPPQSAHSDKAPSGGRAGPLLPPEGSIVVQQPVFEPQPWTRDLWGWLKENTVGIARIDLRRPTPPAYDEYDGNILVVRRHRSPQGNSRPPRPAAAGGHAAHPQQQFYRDGYPTGYADPASAPQKSRFGQAVFGSGARVKITRSIVLAKDPEGGRPLLDLGGGFSVDMVEQKLHGVLRLKIKDWVSIKATPVPCMKVSKTIPLFKTGMGIKAMYELPLAPLSNLQKPWMPPARLMVRLESRPGSGIHLTPNGIECDEQAVRFGSNLIVRGSAGLTFPRSLPIDPENDDFGLRVYRLSLKSLW